MTETQAAMVCPNCGAGRGPDALFCEECAYDFTGGLATQQLAVTGRRAPSIPEAGDESPLDVGWTGPVERGKESAPEPASDGSPAAMICTECGKGTYLDGYCDQCGSKARDPRDHFTESPAAWVGGVCDIGIRHTRNEDAMALGADVAPLSFAAVVVCDGVSHSTDSHIASLAASRAARDVLDDPVPRGMGTKDAIVGAIERRLAEAVQAAERAVIATTKDVTVENPPSCTLVAAVVDNGLAVAGNVGDSRAYWLPDDPSVAALTLTRDDSFAAEQMSEGMPRKQAESGPQAHAITRWLGSDSPDDLTPHTVAVDLDRDGWLMVCSDGLWNYCSEATDLRELVARTVTRLGPSGRDPVTLAQALVDFANEQGGMDNITVALVRAGAVTAPDPPSPHQPSPHEPPTERRDAADGTVHG